MKCTGTAARDSLVLRLSAVSVAAMSAGVLTGWLIGSAPLVQWHGQWAPVQFNTALCFLFAATALLLIDRTPRLAAAAAAAIFLLGAATTVEYLFSSDLGVDRLFVEPFVLEQTSRPGRMAPNTAFAFCLVGLALAIIAIARLMQRFLPAAWSVSVLTALVGAISAAAYVAGTPAATGWTAFTSMAFPTAIMFMATGGVLAAGARRRFTAPDRERWRWLPSLATAAQRTIRVTPALEILPGGLGFAIAAHQTVARQNRDLSRFTRALESEIAERKRAEEAALRLNLELEDRVRERTRDLEATNRELEAFSYSVSHDLRQLLSSIAGYSKLLLDDYGVRLDPAALHYLQRIHGNVTRMGLLDDLLEPARVNRAQLDIQPVDLTAVARVILGRLREQEPQRPANVRVADGLNARAHRVLIEVALENLLANAWKFTRDRKPAEIELGKQERDGRMVFFVRDNGAGFDARYTHKLFGVFQRLHTESEFPGNGAGLATVKRVLARHHGEVWAEGTPGKGAVFFFWLPG
jgi:signal transduction histidine kinase